MQGREANRESKEAGDEQLESQYLSTQKFLTTAILLLAPAANMLATSQVSIGCMKW